MLSCEGLIPGLGPSLSQEAMSKPGFPLGEWPRVSSFLRKPWASQKQELGDLTVH